MRLPSVRPYLTPTTSGSKEYSRRLMRAALFEYGHGVLCRLARLAPILAFNDIFWFVGICSWVILPLVFFMSRSKTSGVLVAHETRNACSKGLSDDTTKQLERQAAPGRLNQ